MSSASEDPMFGRMESIDEFNKLTPVQKEVILEHHRNPSATKEELAKIVGCQYRTVHALFYSEKFEKINQEIGLQGVRELVQRAIRTLEECLSSTNDSVRYAAATKILADAGILRSEPKTVKQDNKILVVWGDETRRIEPRKIINAESFDSILPAPKATGDS